jgi:predicted lipoprotein
MKKYVFVFPLVILLVLQSCGNESTNNITPDSFDRRALLSYYADSLIIPEYERLAGTTQILSNSVTDFINSPTIATLQNAQNSWIQSYTQWQYCSLFNFGPAVGTFGTLLEDIATFPVKVSGDQVRKGIEDYIIAGDNSLNNFARDTRGFMGVEYLLFSGTNEEIIAKFMGSEGQKRKNYLQAITQNIHNRVVSCGNSWKSYTSDFIARNGTDAGSSISELYNEFVKSFESIKNYKLGIPLGNRAGQTKPEPATVEAYYSGLGFRMLTYHWQTIVRVWNGQTRHGHDGIGFKEYIESTVGGKELSASIVQHIGDVEKSLQQYPPDKALSDAVINEQAKVNEIFTELQKITRFFKSDMSSLLGISITYSSGDGD